MADTPAPTWSIRRFIWRAIVWTAAAGVVWKLTLVQNLGLTVWIAKSLQGLVGFPAPYMFCDESRLFWHATLFPPVVGLTLASYWLRWPDRALRTVIGYLAYCCLTAITIIVNESPYLPETEYRNVVTNMLANANYLPFGIVIWVLAAGPWYARRPAAPAPPEGKKAPRPPMLPRVWAVVRHGWITRLVLLIAGVSLVAPLFAMTGTKEGMAARLNAARAMRQIPFFPRPSTARVDIDPQEQFERDRLTAAALKEIQKAIEEDAIDKMTSASLWYLSGNLFYSLRPEDPELAVTFFKNAVTHLRIARRTRPR